MDLYVALISTADETSGHYVDCVVFDSYDRALDFVRSEYDEEQKVHPDLYDENGDHETDYIYDDDGNLTGFCNYQSGHYSLEHYSIEIQIKKLWDTDYTNGQNQ